MSLSRDQCSIRCAIACESMPHLPIHQKWRCLSEGALCAGLSNRASMVIIIDSAVFVQCLTNILGPLCSGRVRPLAQAAAPTADSADNTQHSSFSAARIGVCNTVGVQP